MDSLSSLSASSTVTSMSRAAVLRVGSCPAPPDIPLITGGSGTGAPPCELLSASGSCSSVVAVVFVVELVLDSSESLEEESSPSSSSPSSSESLTSEGPVMTSSVAPWVVALALRTS